LRFGGPAHADDFAAARHSVIDRLIHRVYRDLASIAIAMMGIFACEVILKIALQNYWFGELGQQYRYWFALGLRMAIFAAIFVLGGLFIGFNLRAACRPVAIVP
jgi:hypothetical protein